MKIYKLLGADGKLILHAPVGDATSTSVNVNHLPQGLYLVDVDGKIFKILKK